MNFKAQRIVKDLNGIPIGFEAIETPESVAKRTAELVAQDVRTIIQEKDVDTKLRAEVMKILESADHIHEQYHDFSGYMEKMTIFDYDEAADKLVEFIKNR